MPDSPPHELRQRPAENAVLQPTGWPRPRGFSNGILARGDMVFVGGMVGNDADGR